jgi:predicted DNA-binding antitoxin AbrB/MazE fold protein
MSQEIRAIYENGLFRPLEPVLLTDHDVVSLVVSPATQNGLPVVGDELLARQRTALAEMFSEADSLPLENPEDNFSGADHDLVLYGWKK